jgi:hypothetical protein
MATLAPLEVTPAHNLSRSARAEAAGVTNDIVAQSFDVPRGDVTVTLNYYKAPEDGAVPFNYVEQPPEGEPKSKSLCTTSEAMKKNTPSTRTRSK